MNQLSKMVLAIVSTLSLVACNANASSSYSNITSISVSSLPEGPGVSIEEFNNEANKIVNYKSLKKEIYYSEFCEKTVTNPIPGLTEAEERMISNIASIYGTAEWTCSINTTPGKHVSGLVENNITRGMRDHIVPLTTKIDSWLNDRDNEARLAQDREEYNFESKHYLNPLRMYYKVTRTYSEDSSSANGVQSTAEEYDVTFREDGYMDTLVYKYTMVVDNKNSASTTTSRNYTYCLLQKCTMKYEFE